MNRTTKHKIEKKSQIRNELRHVNCLILPFRNYLEIIIITRESILERVRYFFKLFA